MLASSAEEEDGPSSIIILENKVFCQACLSSLLFLELIILL